MVKKPVTNPLIQNLLSNISADPAATPEAIFAKLSRLLAAPAPANSCILPGTVGEVIQQIAKELGLYCQPLGSTGNLVLEIGESTAPLDLVVTAHMDRPCFRVRNLAESTLYPLCAIRVPSDGYECTGVALRFREGRVNVAASGIMLFDEQDGDNRICFNVKRGELLPGDTVVMYRSPKIHRGQITGTGLDNSIGVLLALLSARMLKKCVEVKHRNRRILFAFTDQEEGPPIGLFGQGAARLAHHIEQPRLGFINIDGHNIDEAAGHTLGVGASHGFVSGDGRGSVVPLDYQALAESLAAQVNRARPGTARLNYSYISRSDDMLLSAWARCLGLTGVIVANAHTTEETAALDDIVAAAHWIPAFIQQIL